MVGGVVGHSDYFSDDKGHFVRGILAWDPLDWDQCFGNWAILMVCFVLPRLITNLSIKHQDHTMKCVRER